MINYRKIWENHHGEIPKDENGRKYDVHHIDGNRKNNNIENLKAVSIKEHYDIHKKQGDWQACHIIMKRLKLSIEEQKEINKKISETKSGKKKTESHKKKISESLRGRKNGAPSESTKMKISNALKGKSMWSEEDKAKMSKDRRGRKLTEECKKKMSKTLRGRKLTEEWKQKISEKRKSRANQPMLGKKHSEETKIKMAISAKNRKQKT